jgi:ribulose-phosphate 3-epimerase
MIKISASALAVDFSNEEIAKASSADYLHIDVMDGNFVNNKTIWSEEVSEIKTNLIKDVHLMIIEPEKHIDEFINSGADIIDFHVEAARDAVGLINHIKAKGVKVGLAISPETAVDAISSYLGMIDQVIVMSVNPGFGGQVFISEVLDKIRHLRELNSEVDIVVDGGINEETGKLAINAGANILVSGTYLFKNPEERIRLLRNL